MVSNGGKVIPAMKKAGFSPAYAKSGKLQKTRTWNELLEDYLPDKLLVKVAKEGLRANKTVSAIIVGKTADESTHDFIDVPDMPTRQRYLETSLKMKNKLTVNVDVTSEGEKIGGFVVVKTEKQ